MEDPLGRRPPHRPPGRSIRGTHGSTTTLRVWSLIDARGWQFDRAGIEGIEWYVMAVGLGIVAGIPVLTLLSVYTVVAHAVINRREGLVGFDPIMT